MNLDISKVATRSKNTCLKACFVETSQVLVDLLLAMNTHNRKIKPGNVSAIVDDLKNDRWRPTNQGIGVSDSGVIIDGGHRLEALRQAGYPPVDILLVTGLPMDSQKYVDQHSKRSMADTLKLFLDMDVSTHVVAVINILHASKTGWGTKRIGPDETIEILEEYSESINILMRIPRVTSLASPYIAGLVASHHKTKNDKIIEFAKSVIDGEMLSKGNPAYLLREWIVKMKGAHGGRPLQQERFLKTMSAINAFIEGRSLLKLVAAGSRSK